MPDSGRELWTSSGRLLASGCLGELPPWLPRVVWRRDCSYLPPPALGVELPNRRAGGSLTGPAGSAPGGSVDHWPDVAAVG